VLSLDGYFLCATQIALHQSGFSTSHEPQTHIQKKRVALRALLVVSAERCVADADVNNLKQKIKKV
jgi:hypothetical protein